MEYQAYGVHNFRKIPQVEKLSEQQRFDIEVVAQVLPFKVNNFVVEKLIDWGNVPGDPLFTLTFPQRDMLLPHHYEAIARLMRANADAKTIKAEAAFGEARFFFEAELESFYRENLSSPTIENFE